MSATAPTTRSASTRPTSAPASSARAPTCRSPSGPASSSRAAVRASTRTPSTTPRASRPPTPRSTSRSCWTWPSRDGRPRPGATATRCSPTSPTTWSPRSSTRSTGRSRRISPEVARGAGPTSARSRRSCAGSRPTASSTATSRCCPPPTSSPARAEAGAGLTRPELATLLAWAKRELKEALLDSDAPEDPLLADAVADPFPDPGRRTVRRPAAPAPSASRAGRHGRRQRRRRPVRHHLRERASPPRPGWALPDRRAGVRGRDRGSCDADRWWDRGRGARRHPRPRAGPRARADVVDTLVDRAHRDLLLDPLLQRDPVALLERDRPWRQRTGRAAGSRSGRDASGGLGSRTPAGWSTTSSSPTWPASWRCAPDLAIDPRRRRALTAASGRRRRDEVADVAFRLDEALGIDRVEPSSSAASPPRRAWARRQHRGLERDLRRLRRDADRRGARGRVRTRAAARGREAVDQFVDGARATRSSGRGRRSTAARRARQRRSTPGRRRRYARSATRSDGRGADPRRRRGRRSAGRQRVERPPDLPGRRQLEDAELEDQRRPGSSEPLRSTSSWASRSWHQASSPGPNAAGDAPAGAGTGPGTRPRSFASPPPRTCSSCRNRKVTAPSSASGASPASSAPRSATSAAPGSRSATASATANPLTFAVPLDARLDVRRR